MPRVCVCVHVAAISVAVAAAGVYNLPFSFLL